MLREMRSRRIAWSAVPAQFNAAMVCFQETAELLKG